MQLELGMEKFTMDLSHIFSLLQSNYFANFFATTVLNSTISAWKKKVPNHNILWQLLNCMQKAHQDTCEMLKWEYNPDAFSNFFMDIGKISSTIYSEGDLTTIFMEAVGHPMDKDAIECWITNFQLHLAAKEHEQLRELLKLQLLFEKRSIPESQIKYVERFNHPQSLDGTHFFTLSELYIPNEYKMGNTNRTYDDVFELVRSFRDNKIEEYLNEKGILISEEIFALFVIGHQCTGKSSLVSKVISDYTLNGASQNNSLYIVSFSDKAFANEEFNINSVCKYLCIRRSDLQNSTLLVDGLDESSMSSSVALIRTEQLIYDLREINCKLLITSRPNFVFTSELRFAWEITLQPFTEKQAFEWLEISRSMLASSNSDILKKQIVTLSPEIKDIILIPYILRICVMYDIDINGITGIPQLYDIIWDGRDAQFALTPYNPVPRNRVQEWERFHEEITEISILYLNSLDNSIPITEICEKISNSEEERNVITEFFLFTKDNKNYSFAHDSIPQYFVAQYLYEAIISTKHPDDFEKLIRKINSVLIHSFVLSDGITSFIEYFIRRDHFSDFGLLVDFCKAFLRKQFDSQFVFPSSLEGIQAYYYRRFISIVRLTFACIAPNIPEFTYFDFFALLSEDERLNFIKYTEFGNESLDCLRICSFSNKKLDRIFLSGTNLRYKSITNSNMRNANFKNANLAGAYLLHCDFSLSIFDYAYCHNTDFSNSTLCGCSFENARLNGANFTNADLSYADLRGAILTKCKFDGANLFGTKISIEQLRNVYSFDIDFIRKNKIEVYLDDCPLPEELLWDEFKKQRPVAYALHFNFRPLE